MSAHAERVDFGRQIQGPSALAGDPRRFLDLTLTLAFQEFKLRFFGSVLGYLWQLMRPLMLFGVLYTVFSLALRAGAGIRYFPAVLLLGIVIFTFFAEATGGAVTAVVDRENLVRKIQFPRLVVPAAVVLTAGFNFALNLVVVAIFALATGVRPHWTWLELPLIICLLAMLALGIATLLSALYVRFRDLKPIWEVVLQLTFYATPIIYPIEALHRHEFLQRLELFFPLGMIVQQARHALIDPGAASAASQIGGWDRMVVPLALIAGIFVLGLWVFNREAPRIAEDL